MLHPERGHQIEIRLVAVIVIAGHIERVAVVGRARLLGEDVPDAWAFAVGFGGADHLAVAQAAASRQVMNLPEGETFERIVGSSGMQPNIMTPMLNISLA